MAQQDLVYIERYLGRLQNASISSNVQTFAIPREHFLTRMMLRLVFPTSTTNNYGAAGSELNAITRIEVIANGQLVLKSLSWTDLEELNKFVNKVSAVDRVALAGNKTAGYTSSFLDFSLTPEDLSTALPTWMFSNLDLKITWAAKTAWGGDDAILPYVDLTSREFLLTEAFKNRVFAFNKEFTLQSSPTATGFNETSLPLGNLYRRIFVRTNGGASTGYVDTTITDLEVMQDGLIPHRKIVWLDKASMEKIENQLETRPAGANLINFDINKEGAAIVDSAPFASFKIRANVPSVSNAVTLTYVPQEIIINR